jgi:hypothetical protein
VPRSFTAGDEEIADTGAVLCAHMKFAKKTPISCRHSVLEIYY